MRGDGEPDTIGIHVERLGSSPAVAYFVRCDGSMIHIEGIGSHKASTFAAWRVALECRLSVDPSASPASATSAVTRRVFITSTAGMRAAEGLIC